MNMETKPSKGAIEAAKEIKEMEEAKCDDEFYHWVEIDEVAQIIDEKTGVGELVEFVRLVLENETNPNLAASLSIERQARALLAKHKQD